MERRRRQGLRKKNEVDDENCQAYQRGGRERERE